MKIKKNKCFKHCIEEDKEDKKSNIVYLPQIACVMSKQLHFIHALTLTLTGNCSNLIYSRLQ